MADILRKHPRITSIRQYLPFRHHPNPDPAEMPDHWNLPPTPPPPRHPFQGPFSDLYDLSADEYTPAPPRRCTSSQASHCSSSEMIDLRSSKGDLPSAGQIIWDDIGEGTVVETLSWSHGDVEREIEYWDRKLRDEEPLRERSTAREDEHIIRLGQPRGGQSAWGAESPGRRERYCRECREQKRGCLAKRNGGGEEEDVRRLRCKEVLKKGRVVEACEFSPGPLKESRQLESSRDSEECRHLCGRAQNLLKKDDGGSFPPDLTQQRNFFHRQRSAPNSTSPTSGGHYLSRKHWLAIILIVLVTGAVGIALPYVLRVQEETTFDERLQIATSLLKQVPLIDGHNDLAWNIRKFLHNRLKDFKFREDLRQTKPWSSSAWSHTDLPRLRAGHVSTQFWSAYVPCEAQFRDAVQLAFEQVDVIRRLTEQHHPDLTLCTTSADILAAHNRGQLCSMIGVEGGHSVGSSLPVLRALYEVGVRYLTLTSTCNTPWADCYLVDSKEQKTKRAGLSNFGKSVVKEMNRLGMVVDLSHVSEATMIAALNISRAPVIFSHSSAHAVCNSTGSVPDRILKLLAENGGMIMVNFNSHFLSCRDTATVQDAIAHIEHVRSVAGAEHIGLGAGYDGINSTPEGLRDVSSFPVLFAELLAAGWSEDDLKRLAGLNFLRVLQRVEQVRDELKVAGTLPSEDVIARRLLAPHSNCTTKIHL